MGGVGLKLGKRRKRKSSLKTRMVIKEQERWISHCVLGKAGHCFALRIKLIALKRKRTTTKERGKK